MKETVGVQNFWFRRQGEPAPTNEHAHRARAIS
jgi:hypothetical protein